MMQTVKNLLESLPQTGRLEWIGLRPERGAEMVTPGAVEAIAGRGLAGDRAGKGQVGSKRQVTLIQAEHLPVIAALSGIDEVRPEWLRRNLLVSGINLLALHNCEFEIGGVRLFGTGLCCPCSQMEARLGPGGYNAMRGHGGITAEVLGGGTLHIGDAVRLVAVCEQKAEARRGSC